MEETEGHWYLNDQTGKEFRADEILQISTTRFYYFLDRLPNLQTPKTAIQRIGANIYIYIKYINK